MRWTEQSWQNQSHYAKTGKIINQHNQHGNVPNEYNNQACIKYNDIKSSQCAINNQANKNTKRGGVPTDRPIKRYICFNLSSSLTLKTSKTESPFCGPHSFARCVPTRWQTRFFIYFVKKWFLEKILGVAAYFNFFLKGKQNKKENLCDSLFGKNKSTKTEPRFGDQVTYWEGTVKRP